MDKGSAHDMIEVSVGKEEERGTQMVVLNKLTQGQVVLGCEVTRVDDGRLERIVVEEVAVFANLVGDE